MPIGRWRDQFDSIIVAMIAGMIDNNQQNPFKQPCVLGKSCILSTNLRNRFCIKITRLVSVPIKILTTFSKSDYHFETTNLLEEAFNSFNCERNKKNIIELGPNAIAHQSSPPTNSSSERLSAWVYIMFRKQCFEV